MKKLLVLLIVVGAGYYGFYKSEFGFDLLKKAPEQFSSLLPSAPADVSPVDVKEDAGALPPLTKCITAKGEVIYGDVPDGTVCYRTEKVDGALTIVPTRAITGGELATVAEQEKSGTLSQRNDAEKVVVAPFQPYVCDGRTHCSHMTSCEEAKFFLSQCPGVKMDGDGDGVPCEEQWCGGW